MSETLSSPQCELGTQESKEKDEPINDLIDWMTRGRAGECQDVEQRGDVIDALARRAMGWHSAVGGTVWQDTTGKTVAERVLYGNTRVWDPLLNDAHAMGLARCMLAAGPDIHAAFFRQMWYLAEQKTGVKSIGLDGHLIWGHLAACMWLMTDRGAVCLAALKAMAWDDGVRMSRR